MREYKIRNIMCSNREVCVVYETARWLWHKIFFFIKTHTPVWYQFDEKHQPGEPPRALRKTLSQAIDLHHEGIIYGTMISSERTFFPGKSLRTMSHAMMLPKGTAIKQVKNEISSE